MVVLNKLEGEDPNQARLQGQRSLGTGCHSVSGAQCWSQLCAGSSPGDIWAPWSGGAFSRGAAPLGAQEELCLLEVQEMAVETKPPEQPEPKAGFSCCLAQMGVSASKCLENTGFCLFFSGGGLRPHWYKSKVQCEFVPFCFPMSITFCFEICIYFLACCEILFSVIKTLICFTMNCVSDPAPSGSCVCITQLVI